MAISDHVKNGMLLGGTTPRISTPPNGTAMPGSGQMTPWFKDRSGRKLRDNLQYGPDFYEAEVQGLDPDAPERKEWFRIRAVRLLDNSAVGTSFHDSWRTVVFEREDITYIPQGTKFWFANACWIAYNPDNIGSVKASAIVRKCDVVWHSMDYYGNEHEEPFILNRVPTKANDNRYQEHGATAEHYLECVMQANRWTKNLRENDRMILGNAAYAVRGMNDFTREFTDDAESVRLLYFSIGRMEPTEHDDMKRKIAGAKGFSWEIEILGPRRVALGGTAKLEAISRRCGHEPERRYSYLWETDGWSSIDEDGVLTGKREGKTKVTCRLAENPDIYSTFELEVGEMQDSMEVTGAKEVRQFECGEIHATVFRNGVASDEPVQFLLDGLMPGHYGAEIIGNTLKLTCYYPAKEFLCVTAKCGDLEEKKYVRLVGF